MAHDHPQVVIRPYKSEDRVAVRLINYETAFLHKPHLFCDDREIIADVLTKYYTDHEPGSCFVAESGGEVIGYIIGTLDLRRMHRLYAFRIFLPLLGKAVLRGIFLKAKTWRFIFHAVKSFLKGEFYVPNFNAEYPATFHLNVKDGFRGQKVGSKLVMRAAQMVYERQVPGVQFSTMSQEPKEFFINFGFHVIYRSHRSFLRYALGHDTPFYLFGMKI
jgi:predicted N-acetyltransferase YhbS